MFVNVCIFIATAALAVMVWRVLPPRTDPFAAVQHCADKPFPKGYNACMSGKPDEG